MTQNNADQYPTRIIPLITLLTTLVTLIGYGYFSGFKLFVIASGSMEPVLSVGTLIVTQPYSRYYPRQVITYYKTSSQPKILNKKSETYNKSEYATKSYSNANLLDSELEPSAKYAVTHRIVSTSIKDDQTYYKTQGDANPHPDSQLIHHDQVVGKVWLALPVIGYLLLLPHYRIGFYLIVILPAALLIVSHLYRLFSLFERKRSL